MYKEAWRTSLSWLILACCLFLAQCSSQSSSGRLPLSSLSFAEVNRFVQSGISETELEKYSGKLEGTRVRWQGTIAEIEANGMVDVQMPASDDIHPNVHFELPASVARTLRMRQKITFTGTIGKVSTIETFPPMPNTYVLLRDVSVQVDKS